MIFACVKKSRTPASDRTTASPPHPLLPALPRDAIPDQVLENCARS